MHPDNEALFEGALLMLLLLSSPEKGQNPVIAARTRQWTFNHILFDTKESYEGWHEADVQQYRFKLTNLPSTSSSF